MLFLNAPRLLKYFWHTEDLPLLYSSIYLAFVIFFFFFLAPLSYYIHKVKRPINYQ